MIGVGFEPTPPKRLVPKTSALDRSAIQPTISDQRVWHIEDANIKPKKQKGSASIGTRTRILSLEGINTTLVLWTHSTTMQVAIPRGRTSVPYRGRRPRIAFIAQLAEHALSKRKVTSSILVEGWFPVWCSW